MRPAAVVAAVIKTLTNDKKTTTTTLNRNSSFNYIHLCDAYSSRVNIHMSWIDSIKLQTTKKNLIIQYTGSEIMNFMISLLK